MERMVQYQVYAQGIMCLQSCSGDNVFTITKAVAKNSSLVTFPILDEKGSL